MKPKRTLGDLKITLKKLGDPKRAKASLWFFKTGPGQYGEGDQFLGIKVPDMRRTAKEFKHLTLPEIKKLLESPIHEERSVAVEILVMQYEDGTPQEKKTIANFYLKNAKRINNWDLVDTSAPYILGDYLLNKEKKILYKLARSKNLWEKRISILSTFWFIRENKFADSLKIAELLLKDKHDLIHKAVGWMLREIGKRNLAAETKFLDKHCTTMPRTMLRYAIEKFPEQKRKHYLKKK